MFPSIQGEIPFPDDTSNYSNTCELPHFFPHIINRKWPKKIKPIFLNTYHSRFPENEGAMPCQNPRSPAGRWASHLVGSRSAVAAGGCAQGFLSWSRLDLSSTAMWKSPWVKKKRFGKCYIHGGGVNIYVSLRAIIKRWLKSFPESIKEYHWSSKSSHSTTENFGYSEPSGNGMCTIQSWDSVRKKKARVPDVLSLGFHRTFGSSRFGLMGFWPPNQQHQSMSCFQDGTCWNFLEQICPEDSFTFGVSSHKKMSSRVCNHADAGLATCRSLGDFQTSSDQMVLNMVVVWMPQSSPPLDLYPINWTGIHVTYVNYANI